MLTGDLNASEAEWIVQYRIADPYKFLFKVRSTTLTFRNMNEALMREVVGDRTVDGDETVQQCGQRIFELILKVASGEKSKSEALGFGADEFAPWTIGATM